MAGATDGRTIERRRDRRLALSFPVEFTVLARGHAYRRGTGLTRDVSPGGVCFETERLGGVRPGTPLRVKVWLTSACEGADREAVGLQQLGAIPSAGVCLSLEGRGEIVRTAPRSGSEGTVQVAVAFAQRPRICVPAERIDFARASGSHEWEPAALAPVAAAEGS